MIRKEKKVIATIQNAYNSLIPQKIRKLMLFGVVGGVGTVVNTLILFLLTQFTAMHYLIAGAIATETAIISNFFGNHFFTFRHDRDSTSLWKRLLSFQMISLFALVGTLTILWSLTTLFGERLLLVWNLIAIVTMFVVNFILNRKLTWKNTNSQVTREKSHHLIARTNTRVSFLFPFLFVFLLPVLLLSSVPAVSAEDLAATSQFGYHPLSEKRVIVYVTTTAATSGTFSVDGPQSMDGLLAPPMNAFGNPTVCQGGVACLVGDFTNVTAEGTYTITTKTGGESHTTASFTIDEDIYEDNVEVFFEFFNAKRQQNSQYHADMHGAQSPVMPVIADGSYILQLDQAALTAVRLGSAYRQNPALFNGETREYIIDYVDFLQDIRGTYAVPGDGPYRFGWGVSPVNAFIPNATNMTTLQLYDSGGAPATVVTVTSLCGPDDDSDDWASCMDDAEQLYHCAANEPCLNMTYFGPTGTITRTDNDHTYPAGWMYDWNCFLDARLETGMFNDAPNSCLMFDDERGDDMYTILAFAAYTQAIPAVYDEDRAQATLMYNEAVAIAAEIGDSYSSTSVETLAGPKSMSAAQKYAWAGMGLFLLYDYSGDETYLTRAHGYRMNVNTGFDSASTLGNEYYWEEYIRHEGAITAAGLTYKVRGADPREYFTGKMNFDWENNDPIDISNSGERVFQKMRSTGFSISRSQIIEAVYALKALELAPTTAPEFTQTIADSQIAWLTGQNAVQDGEKGTDPLRSYSFIFGLGQDNPSQYHSRYLLDTSLFANSDGSLLGARGIDYQFMHEGSLSGMDGRTEILGQSFGALGNDIGPKTDPWMDSRTYDTGDDFIPGWINGAFDTSDGDVILNYYDNKEAYLFTESTNEMVAAAVELFAYMDGEYNNQPRHEPISFTGVIPPNNTNNTNNNGTLTITSSPTGVSIALNGSVFGVTTNTPLSISLNPGDYALAASKAGYVSYNTVFSLGPEQDVSYDLVLNETNETDPNATDPNTTNTTNAILAVITLPDGVSISLDDTFLGVTTVDVFLRNVTPGTYTLTAVKTGYDLWSQPVVLIANETTTRNIMLTPSVFSSGTNAPLATNSSSGSTYHLYELESATFWVSLESPGQVTWSVDETTQAVTNGTNNSFTWTPTIFAVPIGPTFLNERQFVLTALLNSGSEVSWTVDVENVINPFFDDVFGAQDATVRVFTNNEVINFTSVEVTLDNGGTQWTVDLSPAVGPFETDWHVYLPELPEGNTYIRRIVGSNGADVSEYVLTTQRAHYHEPSSSSSRRSSSGGGGLSSFTETLELVYVTLEKDVLSIGDTQTITLDAKSTDSIVEGATALFRTPSGGGMRETLTLTSGDGGYGTWSADFTVSDAGEYSLETIQLSGTRTNDTIIPITDRLFFVEGEEGIKENFTVVYTTFSPGTLEEGEEMMLRLDAADATGVTAVIASGVTSRNKTFEITLERVSGNALYGTWEGFFVADEQDTTYTLTSITLSGPGGSKEHAIDDRSVYARAQPGRNVITAGVAGVSEFTSQTIQEILAKPLIPVIVGFGAMVVVLTLFMVRHRFREVS